ncbi:hypothetical protein M5K25_013505 [Dendrobium thyrsiflorum]|uniref:Uncharacterized protein n=1 Tax=Dendrobium thyrsiflorum TaxID=117978 RepID=A0ABD0UZZ2_DENTH
MISSAAQPLADLATTLSPSRRIFSGAPGPSSRTSPTYVCQSNDWFENQNSVNEGYESMNNDSSDKSSDLGEINDENYPMVQSLL